MGWVWKDDDESGDSPNGDIEASSNPSSYKDRCSTRKILKSHCKTEEVEPGKFLRKCEKTEQILKDCFGRPSEVVQSNKEYTEEDVTDQVLKGSLPLESSDLGPFDFPRIRSDIEAMEHRFFGGLDRFFEAAEDMKNGFFSKFGTPHQNDRNPAISSSSSSSRRSIPVEDHPPKETCPKLSNPKPGHVDLSELARDV